MTPRTPRSKIPKKTDAVVIVVDCSPEMDKVSDGETKSDFELGVEVADWILSRKIFCNSPDLVGIVANTKKGVKRSWETLQPTSFDMIKFLYNDLVVEDFENLFEQSVNTGLRYLSAHLQEEGISVGARTLVVATNDASMACTKDFRSIADFSKSLGVHLVLIGINRDKHKVSGITSEIFTSCFSHQSILAGLSHFVSQQKVSRMNNKHWEIAPGIRLPLTFAITSTKDTTGIKATLVDVSGNKVSRKTEHFISNDQEESTDGHDKTTTSLESKEKVSKEDLCTGFYFGKTLIFFDDDEIKEEYHNHNFNEGETGGCLKLIQFTKKENIPFNYFIGKQTYTVLPTAGKTLNQTRATISLIEAMLEEDAVAICRYAYHASAHIQLFALIPQTHRSTGATYLRGLRLPFSDDMRPMSFPSLSLTRAVNTKKGRNASLEEFDSVPTANQLAAVDNLIDLMMFDEKEQESFLAGKVLDPHLQLQCQYVKNKVLRPNEPPSLTATSSIIQRNLCPKGEVIEKNADFFARFADEFNLQPVVKQKKGVKEKQTIDIREDIERAKTLLKKAKEEENKSEEVVAAEVESNQAAEQSCDEQFHSIRSLCQIPAGSYTKRLFEVAEESLKSLRSTCVKNEVWKPFNNLLFNIRSSSEHAAFFEFMGDSKSFTLISNREVPSSDQEETAALEFWDEK